MSEHIDAPNGYLNPDNPASIPGPDLAAIYARDAIDQYRKIAYTAIEEAESKSMRDKILRNIGSVARGEGIRLDLASYLTSKRFKTSLLCEIILADGYGRDMTTFGETLHRVHNQIPDIEKENPAGDEGLPPKLSLAFGRPRKTYGSETREKPVLIMPGLGEEQLVGAHLARHFEKLGKPAVVGILTFPNEESMDFMCKDGPGVLAEYVNRTHGYDVDAPVNTVGHSQSGGAQLVSANYVPQFQNARHVAIAPVGVNTPLLGETPDERTREFWRRFRSFAMDPRQFDPRLWRMGIDFSKCLLRDTVGSLFANGYSLLPRKVDYALGMQLHEEVMDGLELISSAGFVALLNGEDDPLFPAAENDEVLSGYDFHGRVTQLHARGSHESLISPKGIHQLDVAFDFLQEVREEL